MTATHQAQAMADEQAAAHRQFRTSALVIVAKEPLAKANHMAIVGLGSREIVHPNGELYSHTAKGAGTLTGMRRNL